MKKGADDRAALRQRLTEFYQKHSPNEMDKVDKALATGVPEKDLFEKLYEKYKLDKNGNPIKGLAPPADSISSIAQEDPAGLEPAGKGRRTINEQLKQEADERLRLRLRKFYDLHDPAEFERVVDRTIASGLPEDVIFAKLYEKYNLDKDGRVIENAERARLRKRLTEFYQTYCPGEMFKVQMAMDSGASEEAIFTKLNERFGLADDPERARLRKRLTDFFQQYSPQDSSTKVEAALNSGLSEYEIFQRLHVKYNVRAIGANASVGPTEAIVRSSAIAQPSYPQSPMTSAFPSSPLPASQAKQQPPSLWAEQQQPSDQRQLRERLLLFFSTYNPAEIYKVDELSKLGIAEDELFERLYAKYNLAPDGTPLDGSNVSGKIALRAGAGDGRKDPNQLRRRVAAFFELHAPNDAHLVPSVMQLGLSDEDTLAMLSKKYNVALAAPGWVEAKTPRRAAEGVASPTRSAATTRNRSVQLIDDLISSPPQQSSSYATTNTMKSQQGVSVRGFLSIPPRVNRSLQLASQSLLRVWSTALQEDCRAFGSSFGARSSFLYSTESDITETTFHIPCRFEFPTLPPAKNFAERMNREPIVPMPKSARALEALGGRASDVERSVLEKIVVDANASAVDFALQREVSPPQQYSAIPDRFSSLSNAVSATSQLLNEPSVLSSLSRSGPVHLSDGDEIERRRSAKRAQEAEVATARQEAVLRVREMEVKEREGLVNERLREVMERELSLQERQKLLEARAAADITEQQKQRIVSSRVESMTIREQEAKELERQITLREIAIKDKEKQIQRVISELAGREQALIDKENLNNLRAEQLDEQERQLNRQQSQLEKKSSVDQAFEQYVLDLEYKLQEANAKLAAMQQTPTEGTSSSSSPGRDQPQNLHKYVDLTQRERDVRRREEDIDLRARHTSQREALLQAAEQRVSNQSQYTVRQVQSSEAENDRRAMQLAQREKELIARRIELDAIDRSIRSQQRGSPQHFSVNPRSPYNTSQQEHSPPHRQLSDAGKPREDEIAAMLQRVRDREMLLRNMSEQMQLAHRSSGRDESSAYSGNNHFHR